MSEQTLSATAHKLVNYCRDNNTDAGLRELYADNAVSVEARVMPGSESAETIGLEGIKAKHDWWNNTMDVHSTNLEGPFLHEPDRFGVIFEFEATNKQTGEHEAMRELGIYTVKNGQIIREEFFYN